MKDNIAKKKNLYSTSINQHRAYKHNTQKARRQDGRRACMDIDVEDTFVPAPKSPVEPCADFRIVVYTQIHENYGAHDWDGTGECPQYWKAKGGSEFLIPLTLKQVLFLGSFGISEMAGQAMAHPDVRHHNNSWDSYAVDWELLSPGEYTEAEREAIDMAAYWGDNRPTFLRDRTLI